MKMGYRIITTTETYDPCFCKSYESKLKDANICITKELTDELIGILVRNKERMILHYSITGLGGSIYEPNVPKLEWSIAQLHKLFEAGFDKSHFVLRLDPIIPYPVVRLAQAKQVLMRIKEEFYSGEKIKCIVSIIDQYKHTRERMQKAGVALEWTTFHAPQQVFRYVEYHVLSIFSEWYEFQSCAESGFIPEVVTPRGCISDKDLEIMGMDPKEFCPDLNGTRRGCLCLVKKNCLGVKPGRCPHGCIYCYWKSDGE